MTWSFFGSRQPGKRNKSRRQEKRRGLTSTAGRLNRFEQLEKRNLLAVLTVNTDSGANTSNAELSLREAIAIVNFGSTSGTIPDLGRILTTGAISETAQVDTTTNPLGTNDTIIFSSFFATDKTISLSVDGELGIDAPVVINGPTGSILTVSAGSNFRIFNISGAAGDVTLTHLTLSDGDPGATADGGAIFSDASGLLTIADSFITGNAASDGSGGGVYSTGDVVLSHTTVGGAGPLTNTATKYGGGVFAAGTVTVINNSTITGNTADKYGGGIYGGGDVDVENSTVSGNTATSNDGGGIYAGGNATVKNSTVSGNTAGGYGGGIYAHGNVIVQNSTIGGIAASTTNIAGAIGGGIFGGGNVTVQNSTVSENQANGVSVGGGGGIFGNKVTVKNSTVSYNKANISGGGILGFDVTIQNSTIAKNTADADNSGATPGDGTGGGVFATTRFKMQNSIVFGNSDTGDGFPDLDIPTGSASTVRFSLIGDKTGLPAGGQFTVSGPAAPNAFGNFIGDTSGAMVIPLTAPAATKSAFGSGVGAGTLAVNGAAPPTFAITTDSIAIDTGKNSLATPASLGDERGLPFVRIFGANVDMGAFEFQLPAPEIDVLVNNVSVASGSAAADVGSLSGVFHIPIKIKNTGNAALTVTSATISGGNAGDFVVESPGPASPVAASGGETTFFVAFTPSANGPRSTTLTILNNDSDEGTYTVTLQGTGLGVVTTAPEINVQIDGATVASNNVTAVDLGSTHGAINKLVTIQNLGTSVLNLTGPGPLFVTSNSTDFVVTQPLLTAIPPSGSVSFNVSFMPTANGVRTATLSIPNNDTTGSENPYLINLSGTGTGFVGPAPEINLQSDGADILSGDTKDVGSTSASTTKTFTVQNVGTAPLNLTLPISVTGTNASEFLVTTPPALTTIPNPGSTTFIVTFTPTFNGSHTAQLRITNDDTTGNENPYIINLTGTGTGFATGVVFNENFNADPVSPLLVTQTGSFVRSGNAYFGTRPSVGGTAIVTIPSLTPGILTPHYQVETKVTLTPNGHDLYQNGFIVFDYHSPTDFKYAGAFGLLDRFVIGQVTGGVNRQLATSRAVITAGVQLSLRLEINGLVATLFNGATQVAQHLFTSSFTGTVGNGTINANTSFDDLTVTTL